MGYAPDMDTAWRTQNVGFLMFAARGRFIGQKLSVVHRNGFGTVTDAQLALFHHLDPEGTRLTLIADRANLTKQSMIELVDRAEALAMVVRTACPADGRAKIVRFTPLGLRVLDTLHAAVDEAERGLARAIGGAFLVTMKAKLIAYSVAGTGPDRVEVAPVPGASWRSDNAGRVLACAARRFARHALEIVHERGHRDVSEVLLALFRNLDLDGTRLTELAARAGMTKQSMRELVDRAERLALVERRDDPEDGRAKRIMFTSAGRSMLDEMRRGIATAERHLAGTAGADFAAALKAGLRDYVSHAVPATGKVQGAARAPLRSVRDR